MPAQARRWGREHPKAPGEGKWYWRPTYPGFAVGCAIAWAVTWILLATLASRNTVHAMGYVFLGWVIGWLTATIARAVYPAPKSTLLTR